MNDHCHYGYAEARHDHRGDHADTRHEHGYYELTGMAEEHHRHYSLEHELQSVAAFVSTLRSEVADLRRELDSAYEAARELREDLRNAQERIRALEDRQPDYAGPDAADVIVMGVPDPLCPQCRAGDAGPFNAGTEAGDGAPGRDDDAGSGPEAHPGPCCWRAARDNSVGWWCPEHGDQP